MNETLTPDTWIAVCRADDIVPNTGVCALVNGQQIAVFRVETNDTPPVVYAIANVDPASHAAVLSRGIVGSLGERIVVASPLYKHHYDLRTGECVEEPRYAVRAWAARIVDGDVQLRVNAG